MPTAPLAGISDVVLLIVRLVLGGSMMYYGWPKVKDPAKNAQKFERDGFRPGWLWGGIVLATEFGGGLVLVRPPAGGPGPGAHRLRSRADLAHAVLFGA